MVSVVLKNGHMPIVALAQFAGLWCGVFLQQKWWVAAKQGRQAPEGPNLECLGGINGLKLGGRNVLVFFLWFP